MVGYYPITYNNDALTYFRVSFIDDNYQQSVHVDAITLDQIYFLPIFDCKSPLQRHRDCVGL